MCQLGVREISAAEVHTLKLGRWEERMSEVEVRESHTTVAREVAARTDERQAIAAIGASRSLFTFRPLGTCQTLCSSWTGWASRSLRSGESTIPAWSLDTCRTCRTCRTR